MTALATLNAFRARAAAGEFGDKVFAAPTFRAASPSIEATPVLAPQLPTASVPVAGGSVALVSDTPTYAPPSIAAPKKDESKKIPAVWVVVGGLVVLFLLVSMFKR